MPEVRILETVINDDGEVLSPDWKFTPEGGLAVRMMAHEALYAGELVRVATGHTANVQKTPISTYGTIGVVYEDAAIYTDVWVVVSGMAYVLAKDATDGIAGVYFVISNTAGRADTKNGTALDENLGRVLEDVADGTDVLVLCLLRPSFVQTP